MSLIKAINKESKMSLIIRIVVAIVVGLIVTGVLNYFGLLNASLNSLLGFLAGLVTFFSWDGVVGRTRL